MLFRVGEGEHVTSVSTIVEPVAEAEGGDPVGSSLGGSPLEGDADA
jgi:hypothetical protein